MKPVCIWSLNAMLMVKRCLHGDFHLQAVGVPAVWSVAAGLEGLRRCSSGRAPLRFPAPCARPAALRAEPGSAWGVMKGKSLQCWPSSSLFTSFEPFSVRRETCKLFHVIGIEEAAPPKSLWRNLGFGVLASKFAHGARAAPVKVQLGVWLVASLSNGL